MTSEEKLQYYLNLSYPIEVIEDEDAIVVSIPDLPGCNAFGDNVADALQSLKETKELWLKGRLGSGKSIPEPSTAEEYSGKFVLRIPKILHRALDREARRQGISLNQYVLYLLAERHVSTLPSAAKDLSQSRKASQSHSGRFVTSGSQYIPGLDTRVREVSGELRAKRGDTLISKLRKEYGDTFASGYRGNTRLDTVLEREGAESLTEYLKMTSRHRR